MQRPTPLNDGQVVSRVDCPKYNRLFDEQIGIEMRAASDLLSRILRSCHKQCVSTNRDAALETGERSCTDRCTAKYFQAHTFMGDLLDDPERLMRGPAGQKGAAL
eukprot:Selendium_serpulae@DN5431_c0_g1_i2.p5